MAFVEEIIEVQAQEVGEEYLDLAASCDFRLPAFSLLLEEATHEGRFCSGDFNHLNLAGLHEAAAFKH